MEKEYLTWQDAENYVDYVCARYRNYNLIGVYGLPRGGITLAVMISYRLNIPLLMAPVENCLIVDDICDSGESLLHYKQNSSSFNKPIYHITTMVYRVGSKVKPEFFSYRKKENRWIVFPWENKEE